MENGYDSLKYLRDITDHELKEIQILDERDRKKVHINIQCTCIVCIDLKTTCLIYY